MVYSPMRASFNWFSMSRITARVVVVYPSGPCLALSCCSLCTCRNIARSILPELLLMAPPYLIGPRTQSVISSKKIMLLDAHGIGQPIVEIVQADHVDDIQNVAVVETMRAQGLEILFADARRRNRQL